MAVEYPMREAGEADIPSLVQFRRKMHEEIRLSRGLPVNPEEMAAMEQAYARFARARLKDGTMKAWVIQAQSQIVACGALLVLLYPPNPIDPSGRTARLYSMYTLPEYRRKGLARRIAQRAIEHCKAQGIKRIGLGASKAGKTLYESLGFQPTSEMRLELSWTLTKEKKTPAGKITLVPHQAEWAARFRAEALRLRAILGDNAVAFHHIGSTAIPDIKAKPIIDILVEVRDITRVDDANSKMIRHGYLPKGELGIPGRRYFRKGTEIRHTHHAHVFQTGDPQFERHLNFRDYLRTHPVEAQAYSRLKESLARKFPEDIEGYMDGKDGFIKKIEKKAKAWREKRDAETSSA